MTFRKRCSGCEKEIWLKQINNKWKAYDDEPGTIAHTPRGSNNQNLIFKRFQNIESDISTIYRILDSHSIQLEKVDTDMKESIRNE